MAIRDLFDFPHSRSGDPATAVAAEPKTLTEQCITVLKVYRNGRASDQKTTDRPAGICTNWQLQKSWTGNGVHV
jgi:hypothetical protein